MFTSIAFAQDAAGAAQPGAFGNFFPLILIIIIFYFFLIRPQQKKMQEHNDMINSVERGDNVVTAGGIHGKVTKVDKENNITIVEIADKVEVKVSSATLSNVIKKGDSKASDKKDEKPVASKTKTATKKKSTKKTSK
ncbi:preprotein translocase subunit YajC [Rickettsiales bacterium]|nr:preprotein translocase subunit YajC [Rickettsiales bacterium]